ncbi:MAG: SDR family NAD(P)-dependent oxidoreductase [Bacteroidota bacterium]
MQVNNKVVIITGAGSGIGKASAQLFAEHGAKVVISDINEANAQQVAQEIKEQGGEALALPCNVTQYEEVEQLIQQTVEHFGQLDVMVNNAGIGPKHPAKVAEHTMDDWHNVIAVNQTGVFYCMQLALRQMMQQGSGNIVNIASLAGLKASGKNLSYSASKFAVVGMTKSAALEYASKNIRINAVCPGYTESALLQQLLDTRPDMEKFLKSYIPMKRFGHAQEIAQAVVWLASDGTSFMTGQTVTLDGGTSL